VVRTERSRSRIKWQITQRVKREGRTLRYPSQPELQAGATTGKRFPEIRDAKSRNNSSSYSGVFIIGQMRRLLALFFGASFSLIAQTEITPIAPVGIRGAVDDLIPGFEKKTGYKVKPTYGTGLVTKMQVAD